MCGIFGIYNISSRASFNSDSCEKSLLAMKHRGPDAHSLEEFSGRAILGHLRLSIIDLNQESNQPFQVDDRYWIVFNGEIYNYLELRDELISLGFTFRTNGDTEVLLKAYQKWGRDCVNKFNGMWAFAIFDKVENLLFCSRDRFGVKPFNYSIVDGQFIFSSEVKSIISYFPNLKSPNYNVISNYCRTSIGAQIKQTWFENIFRLEPAHNLIVNEFGMSSYRYWDYPKKVNSEISFDEAREKYINLIDDAVKLRMRSDVPVGFTLSSGIDSTSLVCLLKDNLNGNNNTYTAAFSGAAYEDSEKKQNFNSIVEIDEPKLVKRLAKELDLEPSIVEVSYKNYVSDLKDIIYFMESGHGSPAVFPLYHVFKRAAKDVTVVLEGQGADEMLGGYISNVTPIYIIELIKKFKFLKAWEELKAFSRIYSVKASFMLFVRQSNLKFIKTVYRYLSNKDTFYIGKLKSYEEIKDYPFEPIGFDNLLNEHLYKAHTGGLVNLLHYGDALSMSQSLESRLPFMDYRLVEYAFSLPSAYKVHDGLGKYIHRKAMEGIVPDFIINNPIKFGFDSPLSHIFSSTEKESPYGILLSDLCLKRGLFSQTALELAFEEQRLKKKDSSRILYRMLSVELWFREFIDN